MLGFCLKFLKLWSHAHPDLDTAEKTTSGYFGGLGASMLAGESWKTILATVPSHQVLPLENLNCFGLRDQFEDQMWRLKSSPARVVYRKSTEHTTYYAKALGEQLEERKASTCIVHVDLDYLNLCW